MGIPVAKGDVGLKDFRLVGTPLSRPAVAALASWPSALSHFPLHPKPKRGAHWVPLLSQLPPSAPHPSQAGEDPGGQGGRHHHGTEGAWGRGEVGNAAASPPLRDQPSPPSPPLHLQPNGLLQAPYLIPATAAAQAPSRSPPRPRAPSGSGAPFRSVIVYPLPSPSGPRLARAQQGASREA